MRRIFNLLKPAWWRFEWRYWRNKTPWDTQTTPPEVNDFIRHNLPGRALDLGCGTGTNAIALAKHHWQVTGVDFSHKAIASARRKAAAKGMTIDFHIGDVTDLAFLQGPFQYALDIGCLHSLRPEDWIKYVHDLSRLVSQGGQYMLYAWLPRPWRGSMQGITPEKVQFLLSPTFRQEKVVIGEENGSPSAWYWYRRI